MSVHFRFALIQMFLYVGLSGIIEAQEPADASGNTYRVVTIGTQTWFAENLRTTTLADGTPLSLVTAPAEWDSLKTPAFCWYNNDTLQANVFGALYNWYTVETGKLCPSGWHVPTATDWDSLISYLEGKQLAGGRLKEIGYAHWKKPNTGATNETGFTALPAGLRDFAQGFINRGSSCYWWTASPFNEEKASSRILIYYSNNIYLDHNRKSNGYSVRCIKD